MDNPEKLATLGTQDTGQRLEKTKGTIKNGQSRETGNIGYTRYRTKVRENQRDNQEWTIQRHWQHWTMGTQDTGQRLEKTKGTIKNGQSRETGNIGYTRYRTKVRENQRDNQEWTIQRHWQHWVHKIQDKG